MFEIILPIILGWQITWYPPGLDPETTEQQRERRTMVAEVIAEVAQDKTLTGLAPNQKAGFLMTIFRFESGGLDYRVHGGEVSPIGTQDNMKARCLGQIQNHGMTDKEWRALAGRDRAATKRCAEKVLEIVWRHTQRCLHKTPKRLTINEAAVVFTAYATGTSCTQSVGGGKRAMMWYWIQGRAVLAK